MDQKSAPAELSVTQLVRQSACNQQTDSSINKATQHEVAVTVVASVWFECPSFLCQFYYCFTTSRRFLFLVSQLLVFY